MNISLGVHNAAGEDDQDATYVQLYADQAGIDFLIEALQEIKSVGPDMVINLFRKNGVEKV